MFFCKSSVIFCEKSLGFACLRSSRETCLPDILKHDNSCGIADIKAFGFAKLRNTDCLYIWKITRAETRAKLLMAENKGALLFKDDLIKVEFAVWNQQVQSIAPSGQVSVTAVEISWKTGWDFTQSALGWSRIKDADIEQLDFSGTKYLSTAEDFRHIKAGLQPVEDNNKAVYPGAGQSIALYLFAVAYFDLFKARATGHRFSSRR